MADVKICDRCGKTIKGGKALFNTFTAWRYSLFSPDVRGGSCNWDLCVDCGTKLHRFLNGDELVVDVQSSGDTVGATQPSKPIVNEGSVKKKV